MTNCPHCGNPLNITITPGTPTHKFDHTEARALMRFGANDKELAELYGVTKQAINTVRKKAGLGKRNMVADESSTDESSTNP